MDQFKNLINGLTLLHRASIAAAVIIAGGAIFAVVHYRHEGDFRPLYSAMAPEDAALVVQKLKESGVDYRLAENGGTVLVSSARLADSRLTLASAGLPKSGRIGFELFDKTNFGATELVEHINYQRALEGELERSVMSMAEVVQARVHLTLPERVRLSRSAATGQSERHGQASSRRQDFPAERCRGFHLLPARSKGSTRTGWPCSIWTEIC